MGQTPEPMASGIAGTAMEQTFLEGWIKKKMGTDRRNGECKPG